MEPGTNKEKIFWVNWFKNLKIYGNGENAQESFKKI